MNRYKQLFGSSKPVIGMLHMNGGGGMSALERAKRETEVYFGNGVDAVLVENYFGSERDCKEMLRWLERKMPESIYGVNILGDFEYSFEMANEFGARFIQIDSVSGHLRPFEEEDFGERIAKCRMASKAVVLGGVRFKYQVVASGRSLEEDLRIGMERCDAIVVTGDATGVETPLAKVREFRSIVGDFPLIIGAGVTASSVREVLSLSDGMIIGSYFKENHIDTGEVYEPYVKEVIDNIKNNRI